MCTTPTPTKTSTASSWSGCRCRGKCQPLWLSSRTRYRRQWLLGRRRPEAPWPSSSKSRSPSGAHGTLAARKRLELGRLTDVFVRGRREEIPEEVAMAREGAKGGGALAGSIKVVRTSGSQRTRAARGRWRRPRRRRRIRRGASWTYPITSFDSGSRRS